MNNNFEEIRNKKLSEMTGNELNQLIVESIRESKNDKINDVSQAMKILLVTIYYLFFAVFLLLLAVLLCQLVMSIQKTVILIMIR